MEFYKWILTGLDILVRIVAYGIILWGLWTITESMRKNLIQSFSFKIGKIRIKRVESDTESQKAFGRIDRQLTSMLQATTGHLVTKEHIRHYKALTFVFALALSLAFAVTTKNPELIAFGLLLGASTPYLYLRSRLHSLRIARANQIQKLIALLLSNYRIKNRNIYHALRETAAQLEHIKSPLATPTIKLVSVMQSFHNDEEKLNALHDFIFSINTSLAQQLGAILSTAIIVGYPIENQLVHLNKVIAKLKDTIEEERQHRIDTIFLGFAPLILFPILEGFLYYHTGTEFLQIQFSGVNTFYFILSIIGIIINLILGINAFRPKLDM